MPLCIDHAVGGRAGIVDDRIVLDSSAVAPRARMGRAHRRSAARRGQTLMLRSQRAAIFALRIGDAHHLLDRAEPGVVGHGRAAHDLAGIAGIAIAVEVDRADRLLRLRRSELTGE